MKVCSIIFMILGCFLGAGFVSGREVSCYFSVFGGYSYLGIVITGILMFILIYLFLKLANNHDNMKDFVNVYFGKLSGLIMGMFVFVLLILIGSMLAGSVAIANTLNIDKYFVIIVTAVLSYICVVGNIKSISKANTFLVPIIIAVIMFVCGFSCIDAKCDSGIFLSVTSSFNYVFINIVTLGMILLETSKELKNRQMILISFVSSIVIVVLLFVSNNAILFYDMNNLSMPILSIAQTKGGVYPIVAGIVIWAGLFTTLISSVMLVANYFNNYISNYKLCVVLILFVSILFSFVGFEFIVGYVYSIIGILGLILTLKILFKRPYKV